MRTRRADALRIEPAAQLEMLEIEDEHILGHKPLQIDAIVVNKDKNVHINNKIIVHANKSKIMEEKS